MSNMRIILCANSTSKLIAPIRSRCLLMRVAAPSEEEMEACLQYVAKKEKFDLPPDASKEIAEDCTGNLRKALLVLEALKMQSYVTIFYFSLVSDLFLSPDLSGPLSIAKPDWESYCHKVADLIVQEQSPGKVMEVRSKLYELLSHCIPATVILKAGSPYLLSVRD